MLSNRKLSYSLLNYKEGMYATTVFLFRLSNLPSISSKHIICFVFFLLLNLRFHHPPVVLMASPFPGTVVWCCRNAFWQYIIISTRLKRPCFAKFSLLVAPKNKRVTSRHQTEFSSITALFCTCGLKFGKLVICSATKGEGEVLWVCHNRHRYLERYTTCIRAKTRAGENSCGTECLSKCVGENRKLEMCLVCLPAFFHTSRTCD